MEARHISSTANPTVKEAVRLRRKKRRHDSRLFLAEGEDLLEAAIAGGHKPRQVFVVEEAEGAISGMLAEMLGGRDAVGHSFEFYTCTDAVMQKLSALGSGSRVISIFDFVDRRLEGISPGAERTQGVGGAEGAAWIFLAGVRDPGNAGTIIRSAAALGAAGVIFSSGSADPYSGKAQRAAMGAVFQIPLYLEVEAGDMIEWAHAAGIRIASTDAARGKAPWEAGGEEAGRVLAGRFVLVLGSERSGVPEELLRRSDLHLRIPQLPGAESLNVAMAGTIILYEAARQRAVK